MPEGNRRVAADSLSNLFNGVVDVTAVEQHLIRNSRGMLKHAVLPLISQMGISEKTSSPIDLFDNACGTGVMTQEVQSLLPKDVLGKSSFYCADFAEPMVELVKKRIKMEGWVNAGCEKVDATNHDLPSDSFSHVGIGLGLHIIPDPDAALTHCRRILKNGGVLGVSTWHRDNGFWIPDVRSAFESFPFKATLPDPIPMQLHDKGDWTDPAWIEGHLKELGFKSVNVVARPGTLHIEGAQDFVDSFGMMLTWLTNAWWDEETRKAHPVEEVKELLKEHLEEKYGGKGWDLGWLMITATAKVEK